MSHSNYSDCCPLVVDDDKDFTLLLRRSLGKVGVPPSQISSCSDGEEAIEFLSDGHPLPSFILLDLDMPKRSGLEVLEWIRSTSPPLAEAQVFMMTSSSEPAHVTRAFQLGIGSYFIKPMGLRALEGVLEGIVAYWGSKARSRIPHGSLSP